MTWTELLERPLDNLPVSEDDMHRVRALAAFHGAVRDALPPPHAARAERDGKADAFRVLVDSLSAGSADRKLRWPLDPAVVISAMEAERNLGGEGGALAPVCERAARISLGYIPPDEPALRSFVDDWAGRLVVLAARAAGVRGRWQRDGVLATARAHTLAGHLLGAENDIPRGLIFFPQSDLDRYGVDPGVLAESIRNARTDREGATESERPSDGEPYKLVWKQVVRIHQALAETVDVIRDLDRVPARRIRTWWFSVLELTNALQRTEFHLAALPGGPTPWQRAQIRFQSLFGRTTFRS